MWNFTICDIFIKRRRKYKLLGFQGDSYSPQFPHLVGHSDLTMGKTLRVVALFTVMLLFQSKKITAYKIKDEKEKIIFYFLRVFNLLKITIYLKVKNFQGPSKTYMQYTRIFVMLLTGLSRNSSL